MSISMIRRYGEKLAQKSGWKCYYCNASLIPYKHTQDDQYTHLDRDGYRVANAPYWFATVDHKMPVSRGGTDDLDNLVLACVQCNVEKQDMTDTEYLRRKRLVKGLYKSYNKTSAIKKR